MQVTEDDLFQKLRSFFYEIDEDGSGTLDIDELATLSARLGKQLNQKQLRQAMGEMDEDGSGEVNSSVMRAKKL